MEQTKGSCGNEPPRDKETQSCGNALDERDKSRKESPSKEIFPGKAVHKAEHDDISRRKTSGSFPSSNEVSTSSYSSDFHYRPSSYTAAISQRTTMTSSPALGDQFNPVSPTVGYSLHGAKTPPQTVRVSPHPQISPPCPRLPPFHQWSSPSFYPYSPISDIFFRNPFPQPHQHLLLSAPRMLSRASVAGGAVLDDSKDLILTSSIESLRLRARHHAACLGLLNNPPRN